MNLCPASAVGLAVLAGLIAACGEEKASNLSYASVSVAAAGKDQTGFGGYFDSIKGQRVTWAGRVVEVRKEHGDEFVEVNLLAVDLDGLEGGTTDPDVVFPVSASVADGVIPGSEVSFTGTIEDFDWVNRRPLLHLDVKQIQ